MRVCCMWDRCTPDLLRIGELRCPVQSIDNDARKMVEYLIGVDGGGTGTRVRIERFDGMELGRGSGGPSGLMHGTDKAWVAVLDAVNRGFAEADVARPALEKMAIGLGLAGV